MRRLKHLSLSRLNHRYPRVQAHPEVVQCTADLHHQREHSVILTLSAVVVDSAQTPDRMSRYIWHSAAPTSGCCCSHTTMPRSA